MYKVFFKENCFLLTDDQNFMQEGAVRFIHKDFHTTKAFITGLLESGKEFCTILLHDDIEELFSIFKSCFLYVKAAGGCVCSSTDMLLIKRLGMYDLPKGHLEAGETIEQCAVREVEEECGIKDVEITAPLSPTYHIYSRNGDRYLKKTYWYMMSAPSGQELSPQTEEDIEVVFWYPIANLPAIFSQTYPSLQPVLTKLQQKTGNK